MIDIEDLYEEVLYIYSDKDTVYFEGLIIHISFIAEKKRGQKSIKGQKLGYSKIKNDLINHSGLEKYRLIFNEIMDTLKEDIEIFKKLGELDIEGLSGKFYMINSVLEESKILEKIDSKKKKKYLKELKDTEKYIKLIIKKIEG